MIIFGATGDLTKRKLFPALYNLAKDDFLPHTFAIIGVGRQELTTENFRKETIANLKEFVPGGPEPKLLKWFEERTYYTGGDFDDDKKLFGDLKDLLGDVCGKTSDTRELTSFIWQHRRHFLRTSLKRSSRMASAKKTTATGGGSYMKNRLAVTSTRPRH